MEHAIDDLKKKLKKSGLKEVSSPDGCHFILFFCPIISRAGTDIDNALKYLDQVKASRPVIMVVLHFTNDPEKTILDSNNVIKRENLYAVDCLFNDLELLECEKNLNAINKIVQDSKSEVGLLITMPFTQIVMVCFHRY
ncbi:Mannitol-specific phosphotransferase enzyme IIA component [Labeo rohita]|uniref:Mannitol-specific phosphotransferase enzyme IIA component n=1 Tax=Labeo rohita TaxID=84645 RepID=A0ABQ8MNW6_LABRO|nr:Mannitol-specific phosphotransferase enzyme IIA component [Labeo rohita]